MVDGRNLTINVEYNQLGPLLSSSGGDIADHTGLTAVSFFLFVTRKRIDAKTPASEILSQKGIIENGIVFKCMCTVGNSPFPGNINALVMRLDSYTAALHSTGGAVPEFVNPKFDDSRCRQRVIFPITLIRACTFLEKDILPLFPFRCGVAF